MNIRIRCFTLCLLAVLLLLSSCSSTSRLNDGEYLLVKNEVSANRAEIPTQSEIIYLVKPNASQRFLGLFPWKAAIYQSALPSDEQKDSKWKQWIRKNFGEEPVLLDSSAVDYSRKQILQYLYNNGYFTSKVESEIHYHKKKAKVSYRIEADAPYLLNEVKYSVEDTAIRRLIETDRENSLLKKGMVYQTDRLSEERNRITAFLVNEGYYLFKPANILYRVDSNLNSRRFNLTLIIKSNTLMDSANNFTILPFRKYYIRNVQISYDLMENKEYASSSYTEKRHNGQEQTFDIRHTDDIYYKPKALTYPLDFHLGDRYSTTAVKNSYNRYNDMQDFRLIRIGFTETEESLLHPLNDSAWLDCHIQLSQWENYKLNMELLGKDIGEDYGIGVNLNLKRRNAFHGGEIQYDNLLFSTEFQRNKQDENEDAPMWNYRNFELGGEIGIHFPKMLLPYSNSLVPKRYRAQTRIAIGAYFQQRDHYSRFITNTGMEYEWNPSSSISHTLKLIDVNFVKIYKDSTFERNLATYNQRIREKYTDHVLFGTNYKLIYNSMKSAKRQNYYLLRLNLNAYGNMLYGIFSLTGATRNDRGQYTVAGIPFTSFVSGELDFTYNFMLGKRSSFVLHSDLGLGCPTFNASTLPFERSFYLGGSNSMRAWNLRSLGPGSYRGELSNFESSGDIKIEFNAELRTPLYKNFFTACFIDAGNIWNLQQHPEIPNGDFDWERFPKEIALDAGIGLRWDISFLVFRVDVATALYRPYEAEGKRWIDRTLSWSDLRWCFGLGYPF